MCSFVHWNLHAAIINNNRQLMGYVFIRTIVDVNV